MRNPIKSICVFSFGSSLFLAAALPSAAQTPAAPKPVAQVTKSETTPVGNWLVTCNDYINAPVKRACTAKLQIFQDKSNAVAFLWEIGLTNDKKVVSIMHFPTGVLIGPGVELRIGKAAPRKFPFTACAPAECTAQFPADPAFIKDVAANTSIEAVTQAINGASLTFTINPAGIDKAFGMIGN
jgi:invasion protein IalB